MKLAAYIQIPSRAYERIEQKFNLFTGVLDVSDEVLGTIESRGDFERWVLDIYQQCRTPEAIFESCSTSPHPTRVVLVEQLKGHSGFLALQHLCIDAYEREEYFFWGSHHPGTEASLV